jgi:FemAB-related protein (PEP-CTERM system-associated)
MDVAPLTPDLEGAWEGFVEATAQATFAHLLAWRNVVARTYQHVPCYLLALESGQVAGLLPLFLIRSKLFGRSLVTAPYLSYGGLCADNQAASCCLIEAAQKVCREQKARYVELRSLSKVQHSLQLKEKYCTYLLGLNPDPDVVWATLEQRARTAVRKAVKSGVSIERGPQFLGDFVAVIERLMRDLGTPSHGELFYRHIVEEFSGRTEIFVVRYQEKFIGGGLTISFKDTLAWVYGGCLKAYRDLAAMNLLTWEIIRYGCCQGATYLDFGRSQWGSGTALFKRQWGAEPVPLFYNYHLAEETQMPDLDPTNPRLRLVIAIWKRLPLFVTRALGPRIICDIP